MPKEEARNQLKGWVMDGFPRTFNQAQLMQVCGFLPNKVVVLQENESKCKESLVKKFVKLQNVDEQEATRMADVK